MSPPDRTLELLRRERDRFARAVEELTTRFDEKVEELSLIRQVGDAVGSSLDLKTLLGRAVDLVQEAFSPERCVVLLTEPGGGLVRAASRGAYDEVARVFEPDADAPVFGPDEGIASRVVREGRTARVSDATRDPDFIARGREGEGPVSLLCSPLTVRDRTIGVICLSDSQPDVFEPRHERVMPLIANAVAMAIENARLFAEVKRSREALADENRTLRQALAGRFTFGGLVGASPSFRTVLHVLEKVADTTANVLLIGESGTGKEVVARTLHHNSARNERPFVAINCAALPESLLEAELFGIERGVATGVDARAGTFERADGGTLFLDEIGDMAPNVQARVLRVLQERQVVRVGGSASRAIDVRLVAATHRDLPAEIAAGRFREDLFYRLKVVTVRLPPLRDRREDILPLATHFLARLAARHERPDRPLSRAAARAVLAHPWPGNVRELEHAMEQAVLLADGAEIEPGDLGLIAAEPGRLRVELPETVGDLHALSTELQTLAERRLIERALAEADGNRTHAARALGLPRRTLLYKMRKLSIQ